MDLFLLPEFTLKNQFGEIITQETFKGKWWVFFVYPKDSTPGCTKEAVDFQKLNSAFQQQGYCIAGISPDSEDSHLNFSQSHDLQYCLISDPNKQLLIPLGAWGEKKQYGRISTGVIRSTFLISPQKEIIHAWRNVKATGHAERVLSYIEKEHTCKV